MLHFLVVLLLNYQVTAHNTFTPEECLAAHNELRGLHEQTSTVTHSEELEKFAQEYAERYAGFDVTIDKRSHRILPKRKRRHAPDVDPNIHLESWKGDIHFPDGRWDRMIGNRRVGKNIHKFCCESRPHCPREFFHDLLFPPSAKGVVYDWYNQEIGNYDFDTGKSFMKETIKHFSNIVWKNTTKIGCAQSTISADNCVYTIALYEAEGSIGGPDIFIENIGRKISSVPTSSNIALIICLVVIFVLILFGLIMLLYCCRGNIYFRYVQIKIRVDTLKAEQELETDSTKFWWTRLFRRKPVHRRPTIAPTPKRASTKKERPTIVLVPNTGPQSDRIVHKNSRKQSTAAEYAKRYEGIGKNATEYRKFKQSWMNKPLPRPPSENGITNPIHQKELDRQVSNGETSKMLGRTPSLSGKPPPPPVPLYGNLPLIENQKPEGTPIKPARPAPTQVPITNQPPKAPVRPANPPTAQSSKPSVALRKTPKSIPEESSVSSKQPLLPGNDKPKNQTKAPPVKPARSIKQNQKESDDEDEEKPKSVAEMRRLLEKK